MFCIFLFFYRINFLLASHCELMTFSQPDLDTLPKPNCIDNGPGWQGYLDHMEEGIKNHFNKYKLNWGSLVRRPECVGVVIIKINDVYLPQTFLSSQAYSVTYFTTINRFKITVELFHKNAQTSVFLWTFTLFHLKSEIGLHGQTAATFVAIPGNRKRHVSR